MRILIANDGFGDAGGVQVYLNAVMATLGSRGHELAVVYCTEDGASENLAGIFHSLPRFRVAGDATARPFAAIREWAPDICYSHNMDYVEVDRALCGIAPTVKFMHGYFGTCIGGLKTHAFPSPVACDRVYGLACAALYFPRKCGQMSPVAFFRQWGVARAHRGVREEYRAIVVASEHMRREFVRSGAAAVRVHTNALFPTETGVPSGAGLSPGRVRALPADPHVVFLGRMTPLKGGDLLIRAVHHARSRHGVPTRLTMVGDGPARADWEALAASLGVPCEFTGWKTGGDRWPIVERASLVAVPSIWPEPFGLVGLEAGALGVPAIAVNVGGIGEWLKDGVNGVAVPAPATPESFGDALATALGDRAKLAVLGAGAFHVAREMTLDRHVDRLEALFSECLCADRTARA